MGVTFNETPVPYGWLHIAVLLVIAVLIVIIFKLFLRCSEDRLMHVIFTLGICMLLTESWKQWFVSRYVYPDALSTWFFPWQLCSMSMYCSVLLPFLRRRMQDAVLVFLSTFSVIGALGALLFPGDMMRPYILLFIHSFLYHFVMLVESSAAILILRNRKSGFLPAAVLFLGMATVAEIINIISHHVVGDFSLEANMFNITPYYASTQPVFHDIAVLIGIIPEIVIYLSVIILSSYGLFRAESAIKHAKHAGGKA